MRQITFKIRHGNITAHEEKSPHARREWTVTGQIDFFLLGSFQPSQWVQAANLAMQVCQEMNIPLSQLVTVKTVNKSKTKYSPDQKRLL